MALGYCPVCLLLKTIRKGPLKYPGQREAWYMAEHEDENNERCKGVGRNV